MKRRKILIPLAVLFAASAAALAGCGNKDNPDPGPTPGPVVSTKLASIAISKAPTKTTYVIGETFDSAGMEITAKYEDESKKVVTGWTVDKTAPLTAEDTKVTVSYTEGEVTKTAELTIRVTDGKVHVESISITTPGTLYPNMVVGENMTIVAEVLPEEAENKTLAFESDAEAVATVSSAGVISALTKGVANIKVSSVDTPSVSKTIKVTVNNQTAPTPTETSDGMALVTESNLQANDKVIINSVVEDKYFTMPEFSSGNFIAPVESSVDGNNKLVVNPSAAILTVEINDSALMFKDSQNRYLRAKGGGNYLDFVETPDDGCKFQLNVADGVSTLTCTKEGLEANTLAYNSSNTRFSFYKPGTAETYPKINLYRQDGSQPVPVTAVEFDKGSYEVMIGKSISATAHVIPLTATEKGITYSLSDLSEEGIATIDSATGLLTGVKEGTGKIIAASVENPELTDEASFTVAPLGEIEVDKELELNPDSLGTPSSYNDGGKDGFKFKMLTTYVEKNTETQEVLARYIQGNSSKSSVLWNELPFSKYIEKVVVKIGSYKVAGANSKANFCFGPSAACSDVIAVGKDTEYKLDTAGTFELTPAQDSTYFKLEFTNGASYFESINFVFKDGTVKKLQSISATTTKDTYYVGQSPDKSAIEVTAHYNTGDEVVSDYDVVPAVFNEAGAEIPVTINFGGKSTSFNVAVIERTLQTVVVSGEMTNKTYEAGDAYDPTGLVVTANYDNGDSEVVTEGITWSYSPEVATLGETTVNVTATYLTISSDAYAVSGLTINPKTIAVDSVYVDSGLYPTIEVDEEYQIQAHVMPLDATEQGLSYAVESGSEGYVSVSTTGLVTGLAKGTGYVIVSAVGDATKTSKVKFTVNNKSIAVPGETAAGFNKVTSTEALVEGKRLQMYSVYESSIYDIPKYTTGNNIAAELASIESEKIVAGANVETYILRVNGDSSYSFETTSGKYLAATGTSSENYLKEVDSITDNAKFSITLDGGYAQIVCTKSGVVGNTLAFNNSNASSLIFSCYKASTAVNYGKISLFAKDPEITAVNLTADASGVIVGETLQINAEVLPADAPDKSLVWSSDNEEVATVNQMGVVEGVAAGNAVITATAKNGVFGTYAVEVTSGEVVLTGIELNKDSTSIVEGSSETLTATLTPNNPTYPNVVWASTNEAVATVDSNGVVNAVAPGEATITCTSEHYSSIFDSCIVTVTAKSIDVDKKFELTKDSLKLTTSYGDDTSSDIRYNQLMNGSSSIQGNSTKSSKIWNAYAFSKDIKYVKVTSAVAKASSNIQMSFGSAAGPTADPITMGKDTEYALGAGNSFVITSIPANSKFFNLVFNSGAVNLSSIEFGFEEYVQPTAESVSLNKETLEMAVGDADVTLVATVTPSDASRTGEVWESSDTSVATVTNGVVHAVAAGTTNVTYTLNSHVATCAVKVNPASDLTPITLSKDGGTSASDAKVNGKAAIKCGTGSVAGAMKMTVPTGATKLVFYAAAWKGETVEITVAGLGENKVFSLLSDDGMTSSTPFTLKETDLSKFAITIDIAEALSEDTVITISATTGKRFAVWNAGAKIAAE